MTKNELEEDISIPSGIRDSKYSSNEYVFKRIWKYVHNPLFRQLIEQLGYSRHEHLQEDVFNMDYLGNTVRNVIQSIDPDRPTVVEPLDVDSGYHPLDR